MKHKIFYILFLCTLMPLAAWAQAGGGYNPPNPGDPDAPNDKEVYKLTLSATPKGSSSFNRNEQQQVTAGKEIYIEAYASTGYKFVAWLCDGDTLSKSRGFYYTMPQKNVALTAVMRYYPDSPGDPETPKARYQVKVKAEPANAGSFNFSNQQLEAGSDIDIWAYANTGYQLKQWLVGDSVIKGTNYLMYKVPNRNSEVVAQFIYNPQNPENPKKNYWNKETGEVIIDDFTEGNLKSTIDNTTGNYSSQDVQMITVAGKIGGGDFSVTRDFSNCTLIDMSRTSGIDNVPSYAFYNTNVENVYLPSCIEKIGYRTFAGCKSLSAITLYAMTPPEVDKETFYEANEGFVVYVPASSLARYQADKTWGEFNLMPIQDDIHALQVSLPQGTDAKVYSQMWIELTNTKSGQKMHYVMTGRDSYTFANLIKNTTWNVTLRNARGDIFAEINNVEVKDEDVKVSFNQLAVPQQLSLSVAAPDGTDVTSQTQVTWTDQEGNYLAQSFAMGGLLVGSKLNYSLSLNEQLATQYAIPGKTECTVKEQDNNIKIQLQPLPSVSLSGKVTDLVAKSGISGAIITASQTFDGKYTKTVSSKADQEGKFSLNMSNVPTQLTIAATDYVSQSIDCTDLLKDQAASVELGDVALKPISGATLSLKFNYKRCCDSGEEAEGAQGWFSDYNNVVFGIYNKTQKKSIKQFSVQYPQIVLLEEVSEGDQLELTATSKSEAFMPVTTTATIDNKLQATVTFNVAELGKIEATYSKNYNVSVVGSLYDAAGKLQKTSEYANASLTFSNLSDGYYTLLSMGKSKLFNTVYKLDELKQSGLKEGTDYILSNIKVESGNISKLSISEIPTLNESKLYFTGDNTSFTVNKQSIVAGNYITLTGKVDFKQAYAKKVSNVSLVVDIPDACSFVENSVMVGNSTSNYVLEGNRLTIQMARYTDRVRFCVIPTQGGEYAPSAQIEFELNGNTMSQPIGSASYTAKDLSISVPKTVAKTSVSISGMAIGRSEVKVYDGDVLIGQTTSLANGMWSTKCELNEAYNLSLHNIHAKVITKQGLELQSETQQCLYDENAIQVKTVDMSFYNGWMHKNISLTFDFESNKTSGNSYSFYTATDFTFVADLTNNDPKKVSDVTLYVYTTKDEVRKLTCQYDEKKDKWVAICHFTGDNLPVNLDVSIISETEIIFDRSQFDNLESHLATSKSKLKDDMAGIIEEEKNTVEQDKINQQDKATKDAAQAELENLLASGTATYDKIDSLYSILGLDTQKMQADIPADADKEWLDKLVAHGESLLEDASDMDKIDVTDLLKQCDELLKEDNGFNAKEIAELAGKDTLSVTSDNGETYTIWCTKVSLLNSSELANYDSTSIVLSEGLPLVAFFNKSNDKYIIADQEKDLALCIVGKGSAALAKALFSRAKDDGFLSAMNKAKSDISALAEAIISPVSEWISEQNEKITNLRKTVDDIKSRSSVVAGRSAGCHMKIQDLEKQLRELRSQNVVDLNDYKNIQTQIKNLEERRTMLLKEASRLNDLSHELESKANRLTSKLTGAYVVLSQLKELYDIGKGIYDFIAHADHAIQDFNRWTRLKKSILPCTGDELNARALYDRVSYNWTDIAWKKGYYPSLALTALATTVNGILMVRKDLKFIVGFLIGTINGFINNTGSVMFDQAVSASKQWYGKRYKEYMALKCKEKKTPPPEPKDDNDDDRPDNPPFDPINPIHDPSGYVYEAVASNRVPGVTATCYYKEMVEDMYGDLHENIVKWDAEEYAQQNPLFTDENGMYQWDVPQGMWQVKFEKEGYETAYSEWLPVPPPQLEVNVGIKQNVQPLVKGAKAYEQAIELEFDKYMMTETLNEENIIVMEGDKAVKAHVKYQDLETSGSDDKTTYARKIRVEAEKPFEAKEVQIFVSNKVKNYAGIRMQEDYTQTFGIELEVKEIACDSIVQITYGEPTALTIQVLPVAAAAGKTLQVSTSSSMMLNIESSKAVVIGEDGKAEVTVTGELPGTAALTYTIEGYDIEGNSTVKIAQAGEQTVATPTANVASGSEVQKGAAITLACATKDATIYYTLDGSCPCLNTENRKVYDGTPVIINETSVLKVMATAEGMAESDIAEYTYIVSTASGIKQVYTKQARKARLYDMNGQRIDVDNANGVVVTDHYKYVAK